MPHNWKTYKLGEICEDIGGGTPSTKKTEYYNGDISWITPRDLSGYNSKYIKKGSRSITKLGLQKSSAKIMPKGTVLLSSRAPIGYLAIALNEIRTNQGFKSLVVNQEFCYNEFIYYLLKNNVDVLLQNASGSTFQEISGNVVKGLSFPIPPLPEQRAIASILSTIDDQIENNLAMNKTLEEMAMALYKHWFVDFGPFQEGNFVESELGEIPEGWEVKELKDVAKVNQRSLKKDHSFNEINYIDISSVGTGLVENNNIIESGKAPSRAKRLLNDGDIVWSTVRPTRRSYFLALGYAENTVVSTGFAVISPVKVPYSYLYPLTCTQEFVDYLDSRSTGAAYPAVTGKVFEQARIIVPSKKSLDEYSEIVSNYYRKISANLEENQTLIAQRDALLPKLVSGEVRVKGFE